MEKILAFIKQYKWILLLSIAGTAIVIFFVIALITFTNTSKQQVITTPQSEETNNAKVVEEKITEAKVSPKNNILDNPNIVSYLDNLEYVEGEDGLDLAIYTIENEKINLESKTTDTDFTLEANNTEEHNFLWNYFYHIFGEIDVTEYIDKFIINTDGVDGSSASMYLNDDNVWGFYVDPADTLEKGKFFDLQDFTYTLVHEFGHLLTLNDSQVDYDNYDEYNCFTHLLSEGCLYDDAYSFVYFEKFWSNGLYEDWKNNVGYDAYEEDQTYFYEDHPGVFITEYASTDTDEDIAESFAHFVLTNKPTGKNIAEQKISFFYDYPELVNMRNTIRKNIESVEPDFFSKPLNIQ
ncbi:MAG: hypothetical protein ACD_18C00347G0014 [uncultured bacterium]|nr:MAG: hypothetical protein ACD_18C00347G0014 [uncultured bacterium]OGH83641.1 MAG: hypothetical protein A2488_01080 [Candidatus Magasanikbacteria bacterium RIFOXYC12_FULL_32_21b]OGH91484.1 MAG: hypothetical protein A2507_00765 [Candidatus Magasanikbacteria bacterium RIFOXYD12_FULL_33_17]HAO52436.1 hypothetical protein [Candidatus Magasanikbacteria bacterium]